MSRIELCRCCGQPLPPKKREGVYLPAKKACIFDFVRDHPGVTLAGIRAHCFPDGTNAKLIHVHINQINDLMAGTGVKIVGEKRGGWREPGLYRIKRSKR
jgi:hypothetical protein